jgi:integrase
VKPARGLAAWIEHRPSTTRTKHWGVFWNVYAEGHVGRPKPKSKFLATQAEAIEFRDKFMAAMTEAAAQAPAAFVTPAREGSVAALTQDWLTHVKRTKGEGATWKGYRDTVKHYIAPAQGHPRYPAIGDVTVHDEVLVPKVIGDLLLALADQGVSLSMRHRVQRAISAFCTYCKYAGKLRGVNPAFDLGRQLKQETDVEEDKPKHPFSDLEVAAIFADLAAHEDGYLPYFQFLLDVGVRPGEAAALLWDEIDFVARKAWIKLSYSPALGKDKRPKTHEIRQVSLTKRLVEILLAWRQRQREMAFSRGLAQPAYVFTTLYAARGAKRQLARQLQDGNIQLVLDRVLRRCQIPEGHRLYDFRHTFATMHLSRGWEKKLEWVSKQLGHKTPATTQAHYYAWRDTVESEDFADEIAGF